MDPLAHSLAGACMAQTGLKKFTPLATLTLVIAANVADIDVIFQFVSKDAALFYRRGLTHGLLAILMLPFLVTGLVLGIDRFLRRRRGGGSSSAQPVRPRMILALSFLGVLSHPLLDWLNTYGVRLLMPFSTKWFYGDTLFIIDPWMWLLMAAAVVLACSKSWLGKGIWIMVGGATSALVATNNQVPYAAKFVWWFGVAIIIALQLRKVTITANQRIAAVCFAAFFVYLGAMGVGNSRAR